MAKSQYVLDLLASGTIFNTEKIPALTKQELDEMRTEMKDSRARIRRQHAESQVPPRNYRWVPLNR